MIYIDPSVGLEPMDFTSKKANHSVSFHGLFSSITLKGENEMESTKLLKHNIASLGEAVLLIWWGVVLAVNPLTIGIGAMGTGLILLGVNAVRLLKGLHAKSSTTAFGIVSLTWGALDQALRLDFWPSFAVLLIVIGMVQIGYLIAQPRIKE
jgi:hypothetical protein